MTKYALQMTCKATHVTQLITNNFSNRTTACQILEQKRLRALRQGAILTEPTVTERGDGFFAYKQGGMEYRIEVVEV